MSTAELLLVETLVFGRTAMGEIVFCDSIEEAVRGASWIQESVPERLDLKHQVLARIESQVSPDALIGRRIISINCLIS